MVRQTVVTGNWKMYKTVPEATQFVKDLASILNGSQVSAELAVPFTAIFPAALEAEKTSIRIGAQNMHDATEGAFTGEISAKMLVEAGAQFVVLGHSERRHIFGEDNAFIKRKLERALHANLPAILCIGETLEQREQGQTEAILHEQLQTALGDVAKDQMKHIRIAYEPVWAIGTGVAASPEEAQAVHAYIRQTILELFSQEVSESVLIQYGGSVKADNAAHLIAMPDIDGMLVGGASLQPQDFTNIIQACQR